MVHPGEIILMKIYPLIGQFTSGVDIGVIQLLSVFPTDRTCTDG